MSGSGVKKRARHTQVLAYQLRQQGLTNGQIAERLGKDVKAIPRLIQYGERFAKDGQAAG